MSRPTRRLRTRLLIAMVAIAFGVLVVAALGAAGLARDTASDSAIKDLEQEAPDVAKELSTLGERLRQSVARGQTGDVVCRLIAGVLRISGGSVVVVGPDGDIEEGLGGLLGSSCVAPGSIPELPRNLTVDDLNGQRLRESHVQTGVEGSSAFIAQPLPLVNERVPVLVLTQQVETRPLGRAGPFLLGTGAFALIVAAVVSAFLARRLTRPIAAMQHTAGRIAGGDLAARVGAVSGPNDELASLARSLDAMADDLETARGHERAFLLSVSHDLRTPLTSIQGYAEAIGDGTADSPQERMRAAGVIAAEARRLERLVADLLDLARIDAHQFSLKPTSVDARAVVGAAVQGFAPTAQGWDLEIQLTPGDPVPADADPERLGQIVANLVENALKYAKASVVVDVTRRDGQIELRVDDDGPGISTDDRNRVFERLYMTRGTPGRAVGTGIGLAIVHELAVAMGGAATCEPLDGGGTRFVVRIPA